jgi:hypothetical protein
MAAIEKNGQGNQWGSYQNYLELWGKGEQRFSNPSLPFLPF